MENGIGSVQIGFLGICGTTYPVKLGLNRIGRHPHQCDIVLESNSISRQHALINILNVTEFFLIDVNSTNKTTLNNNILQPYIPYKLKNCDLVQFGGVFGVFRTLEYESNVQLTQPIPDTSDISDSNDSFMVPSQPNAEN